MNKKNITNVIIVGAPRSGTTLLSGLTSAHVSSFPMLPECSYITTLIRHYWHIIQYSDPYRFKAYAVSEDKLLNIYRHAVEGIISNALSHFSDTQYSFLILKDPELTMHIDLIPDFFGDQSKIVCIVRDPRAVIASMLEVIRNNRRKAWRLFLKKANWENSVSVLHTYVQERRIIFNMYNYYYAIHSSNIFKQGKLHITQYEKITAHDEEEFDSLDQFLGFKIGRDGFGKSFLEFDNQDVTYSENYGKEIKSSKLDFRKTLSKRYITKIQNSFGHYNQTYHWW